MPLRLITCHQERIKNPSVVRGTVKAKNLFNLHFSELPIILDIRSEEEFQQSHLLGAISLPLTDSEGVHELQKEGVEKALLETVFRTFHQPHLLPPKVKNLKGPKGLSLPTLPAPNNNDWLLGCNGGYPGLFAKLLIFCDPEQTESISFNFLITILRERGFPIFYEEENTSGVFWEIILQVQVLDSFVPFH
jgi:rhodanese-related sulfurtransferase